MQNSADLFFQDTWSATSKLTLNFGLRYTLPGVLGASDGKLTNFLPAQGMVSTDSLYPAEKDAVSPRLGVTWVPSDSRKTVIRSGYGLFYDMLAVAFFTANTGFANGGALGVDNNPGGDQPVFSITQRRQTVVNNVPIFGTTSRPPYGAFAVSQDLQLPYVINFNVNVEQQLGPTTIAQIGYVGTRGHRLALMRDINAATPGATLAQTRRPFNALYRAGQSGQRSVTGGKEARRFTSGLWTDHDARAILTFGGCDRRFAEQAVPPNAPDLLVSCLSRALSISM